MKKKFLLSSTIACACAVMTPTQGFAKTVETTKASENPSTHLDLSRDGELTSTENILNQIKNHPDLQRLNLAGVYQAADPVVMQSIHDNLPKLKDLDISGYVDYQTSNDGPAFDYYELREMKISPEMLTALLSKKSLVEVLDLSISNLDDQGLKVIAQNGNSIRELNLTGTAVTEKGVHNLIAELPNLKEVILGQVKMSSPVSAEVATLGFAPSQDLINYANSKHVKLTVDNQKY